VKQIFQTLLILTGLGSGLFAQDTITTFSFSYIVNGIPLSTQVNNNGFISFPDTNLGKTSNLTFFITSNSKLNYNLVNPVIADITPGITKTAFAVKSTGFALAPNGSGQMGLSFTPLATTPQSNYGLLQFQLVSETGNTFNVSINLFANALQPQLILSYTQPDTGNQIALMPGATIQFPKTQVNKTSTAMLVVTNSGNGAGTVDGLTINGAGFSFSNLPLTPATVAAKGTFTVGITFSPLAIQNYTGTFSVSLGGVSATYNLAGTGTNSSFSYDILTSAGSTPLSPGGTITLPDTPADGVSKSSITVRITNSGNQDGTVSAILATGTDFQVAGQPVLPVILKPGDIALFSIVFFPAKSGISTGRLQVGNDLFNLSGTALGAALSLAVDLGLGPVAAADKAIISLPNTGVGDKRPVYINVTNTGNVQTIVSGIGVTGTGFSIVGLPPIPATLSPSQTIQFQVQFAPTTVAVVPGVVTVNDLSLTLLGVGAAPPALPGVTFTNLPAAVSPLQQPSVGLQLSTAYPYDLKGTLTLSFLSDSYADDPSIQFATGGRTIDFRIPANTTTAVFLQSSGANFGTLIPFQTGTVSGSITLSAAGFTVGQVDVTPGTVPSKSLQIPAGPPQLSSVRVDTMTNNQLVLLISGYSTTRSVSQLSFKFTGVPGSNVATANLNVDVSSAFANWYANSSSATFGSQFTVSVTVTVAGDPTALQSIAVTATNSKGTSGAQTVTLR
jgi:hypothetical protein